MLNKQNKKDDDDSEINEIKEIKKMINEYYLHSINSKYQ
jgi:hypothetical protein